MQRSHLLSALQLVTASGLLAAQPHHDAGYAPHHRLYACVDWRFVSGWMLGGQINHVADRDLAASAIRLANGNPGVQGILPLGNVLTAFNTRTANHLGLAPSSAHRHGFSLIFPEH